MRNAGLSEEEIVEITGCEVDKNGEFMLECDNSKSQEALNASSDKKEASKPKEGVTIIPSNPDEVTRIDYDLTYYVNDINTANTQVLMTYGRNQTEKAVYVYGEERIAEDDLQKEETSDYLYDGRGSVVQTTIEAEIDISLTYDPFGEITSGADENFVGYAYNGEESNEVTGLQYLRARYYDTELGSFITIDTYLGSLDNALSQNRYTYAHNDPVNNIDPSGHYSVNVNGTSQYYQTTGLNELRDYMTAAALWAGQVTAQSSFNGSVARASNTSFMNYQSITGISQSTANNYINKGIVQAGQVSMNYGCSVPTVPNQAVAKFSNNVNSAKNTANAQINNIKANKKTQYDEYLDYLAHQTSQNSTISEDVIEKAIKDAIAKEPSIEILVQEIKKKNGGTLIGFDWSKLQDPQFVSDTTFQGIVNDDVLEVLVISLKNSIKNTPRPNNIGKGIWNKQVAKDLQWVDDVLGTGSKVVKGVKALPYIAVIADVTIGGYENYRNGESHTEIKTDMAIDTAFGLGNIGFSTLIGSAGGWIAGVLTGAAAGSTVPVIGTIIGGIIGGVVYYGATEGFKIKGKSIKEHVDSWFD